MGSMRRPEGPLKRRGHQKEGSLGPPTRRGDVPCGDLEIPNNRTAWSVTPPLLGRWMPQFPKPC
eukprot:6220947-Pyramimonas_sp.AAC.1